MMENRLSTFPMERTLSKFHMMAKTVEQEERQKRWRSISLLSRFVDHITQCHLQRMISGELYSSWRPRNNSLARWNLKTHGRNWRIQHGVCFDLSKLAKPIIHCNSKSFQLDNVSEFPSSLKTAITAVCVCAD